MSPALTECGRRLSDMREGSSSIRGVLRAFNLSSFGAGADFASC